MNNFDSWNKETDSLCPRRAFEAGQQSMQSKIEQLEKRIAKTLDMLEGDLSYVEEDRRRDFDFLQMAMIRCLKEDIKALRGECE